MIYFRKASELGDEESADNLMFAASVNDQVQGAAKRGLGTDGTPSQPARGGPLPPGGPFPPAPPRPSWLERRTPPAPGLRARGTAGAVRRAGMHASCRWCNAAAMHMCGLRRGTS